MKSVPAVWAWGLICSLLGAAATSACDRVEVPDRIKQGGLAVACAPPGSVVHVGEQAVKQTALGQFVFGAGRDTSKPIPVVIRSADGKEQRFAVAVSKRDYPIERVDGLPPQTVTPDPIIAARIAREQAQVAQVRLRDDARADFSGGFRRPAQGRISGVYGSQRILNGEPRNPHYGLDIAVPTGTPVLAPAPGIVTLAEPDLYLTGGTVLIDHGLGLTSSFLHLSRLDVKLGDRVERGQRIGAAGATGRASGPHLHWGFNWFETRLDPALLPAFKANQR